MRQSAAIPTPEIEVFNAKEGGRLDTIELLADILIDHIGPNKESFGRAAQGLDPKTLLTDYDPSQGLFLVCRPHAMRSRGLVGEFNKDVSKVPLGFSAP